jgi:hypothetical protein
MSLRRMGGPSGLEMIRESTLVPYRCGGIDTATVQILGGCRPPLL